MQSINAAMQLVPWNKGKLVGQKAPLKLKEIWAIRVRLQLGRRIRDAEFQHLWRIIFDLVKGESRNRRQRNAVSSHPCDSCGFCAYVSREVECAIIAEDDFAMAFVNHCQYERGAALIVPKKHRETILNVTKREIASVYTLAKRVVVAVEIAFAACGANIFQNDRVKAGQHVPHMHLHVVPRYEERDAEKLFQQRDFAIAGTAGQHAVLG